MNKEVDVGRKPEEQMNAGIIVFLCMVAAIVLIMWCVFMGGV